MYTIKSLISIFIIFCTFSLFGQLTIATDQADATYNVGESMNFVVRGGSGLANYTIHYDHGVTPAITAGSIQLNGGTTNIPFRGTEPSVVLCTVTNNGQTAVSGAAFSPFDIQPFEEDPVDFDAFWQNQKNELAAVPINPRMTPISTWDNRTRSYRINLGTVDGRRVYGYLSIPLTPGNYPAIITHAAFGVGPNLCVPRPEIAADIGAISLSIWMHNAEPDQQAPNAYFPKNWDNPSRNYFRYGILGIIRAIDYIQTLPEFDGQNIGLNGISEGGGMSILAAGIDSRVKAVTASIFAHGEHSGYKYGRASGFPYYMHESTITNPNSSVENINQGAKYFDALRAAKRYKGPILASVGYTDLISIPATNFAVFNQFEGSKVLIHKIGWGHRNPDEFYLGKFEFFRKHFNLSGQKGYAANAGTDQFISGSNATLSATVEKNGQVNTALPGSWKLVSGPGTVSFANQNSRSTVASFSQNGEYVLSYTATDNSTLFNNTYFTIADRITVSVGSNNQRTDADNDGVPADEDCNDFNPNISRPGDACNDFNPNTFNDVIQNDCSCSGTLFVADPCANAGGDADNDGVCANQDCNDFNPNISRPGDACNDFNPNTSNDVIQNDCSCSGTMLPPTPSTCQVNYSVDGLILKIEPLNEPIKIVKVFDQGYNVLLSCEEWGQVCGQTEVFTLPRQGNYFIQIQTFADWSTPICNIFEEITASGISSNCQSITNGGQISGNENICPDDTPSPILSSALPIGGSGTVEYLWLSSTSSCPNSLADAIPGANQSTYSPGQLSETTYFRRLSRRAGCTDWFNGNSNCIAKTIQTDCNTTTTNCKAQFTLNRNQLRFTKIDAPIANIKVIRQDNSGTIFSCSDFEKTCQSSFTIRLTPGKYFVQILTGESWAQGFNCNIFEGIEVPFKNALEQIDSEEKAIGESYSNKEEDFQNSISIAPNPAHNFIKVSFGEPIQHETTIELINSIGKIERTITLSENDLSKTIQTDDLTAGLYFVRIHKKGSDAVVKRVLVFK